MGKISLSKWLLPLGIVLLLGIGLFVVVFKGSWRTKLKAKGLWQSGVRLAANGEFGDAAEKLESAYDLIGFNDRASDWVGEESRGHMVLSIAQAHQQRGRKDQIALWEGEWKALDDYEKPFSKDFNEALEQFGG